MKKSLLALILAVALVAPAFAAKGDKSINAKLGLGVNNYFSEHMSGSHGMPDGMGMGVKMEMPAISLREISFAYASKSRSIPLRSRKDSSIEYTSICGAKPRSTSCTRADMSP